MRIEELSVRERRFQRRHKGTLLCEWCNRFVRVSYEEWKVAKGREYVFFCNRQGCVHSRTEAMGEYSVTRKGDFVSYKGPRLTILDDHAFA